MSDSNPGDSFELRRFVDAQEGIYDQALAEIKRGSKRTHWMWFIFPQIDGLGFSAMAKKYAIRSLEEARQYLDYPVLGSRLNECAEALLAIDGRSASEIFGSPDDLKLHSSMTLFAAASATESVFGGVLEKYFRGERDSGTVAILQGLQ